MAIAHDNTVISAIAGASSNSATLTWSHTVGAGANNYGLVTLYESGGGSGGFVPTFTTPPSVTIGSTALTSLGSVLLGNVAIGGFIWVFGASGIPTGSQTVTATVTDSGQNWTQGYGSSSTYTGVGSVGTLQTAFLTNGAGSAQSVAVSSATGHTVWGAVANYQNGTYSSLSFTQRASQVTSFPFFTAGDMAGASSVNISATQSATFAGAQVGLDLIPVTIPSNQFFLTF